LGVDGTRAAPPLEPDAPAVPLVADAPAAPLEPDAPVTPLVPDAPAVPLIPGAPGVPLVPGAPAVPLGSDEKSSCRPHATAAATSKATLSAVEERRRLRIVLSQRER
jgi:hypothetical protein